MSDELDQLSDAALSERFAVEVAGWALRYCEHIKYGQLGYRLGEDDEGLFLEFPPFATSADAVLPYLEAPEFRYDVERCKPLNGAAYTWVQVIMPKPAQNGLPYCNGSACAPTFARAACIALIKAKRAEKGTP